MDIYDMCWYWVSIKFYKNEQMYVYICEGNFFEVIAKYNFIVNYYLIVICISFSGLLIIIVYYAFEIEPLNVMIIVQS